MFVFITAGAEIAKGIPVLLVGLYCGYKAKEHIDRRNKKEGGSDGNIPKNGRNKKA